MVRNLHFFLCQRRLGFHSVEPFNCVIVKLNLLCQLIQLILYHADCFVVFSLRFFSHTFLLSFEPFLLAVVID